MGLQYMLVYFQLMLFHLVPRLSGYSHSNLTCPQNFVCQNLGPLKFPFSNSTLPNCGLCMVECYTDSPPRIKLDRQSEQWFHVKGISHGNFIQLHDPVFQYHLRDQNCHPLLYNLYLPSTASISYTIVSNITLFKCSKSPDLSQKMADYFRGYKKTEPCAGFEIYYGVPKYNDSQFLTASPPFGCSTVYLPMRSLDNVSADGDLFDLLTADFDLQWHLSDECYECHRNGGKCQSDDRDNFDCTRAEMSSNSGQVLPSVGGIVLLVILAFCVKKKISVCNSIKFWKYEREKHRDLETFLKNYATGPKRYHYSNVKKMTNSFKTKLGQGGYGSVYKGKLQDGRLVAVKILKESKGNGEEFINEVASISGTSHVNIVTLLGYCFQDDKRALIYEFMANGSLEKFIYGEKLLVNRQLDWSTLCKIAIGIARGLEYLHRGCNTRILHFDIKPHNILLDEDFCPKISDFGLAKLCPGKESIISMMTARGTIGYIAPEVVCKNIGGVSHKSDVYSYGMMVLEMVGGRKNVDVGVDRDSEIYFPHWIYTKLVSDDEEELGLSGITNEKDKEQARKMLMVSLWCIQTDPSNRPSMTNAVEMLEGSLEALKIPPKPYLYSPPRE